jgi:hypothetical protein
MSLLRAVKPMSVRLSDGQVGGCSEIEALADIVQTGSGVHVAGP